MNCPTKSTGNFGGHHNEFCCTVVTFLGGTNQSDLFTRHADALSVRTTPEYLVLLLMIRTNFVLAEVAPLLELVGNFMLHI